MSPIGKRVASQTKNAHASRAPATRSSGRSAGREESGAGALWGSMRGARLDDMGTAWSAEQRGIMAFAPRAELLSRDPVNNCVSNPSWRPPGRSARRAAQCAALVLALLTLAGCSLLGIIYNRLDWAVGNELSRYVDLDDEQERLFEREFAALWAWHRSTELPAYARDLRALAAAADRPLTTDVVDAYSQRYLDLWVRVVRQGQAPICALLATLSDEQVGEMLDEAGEDLEKFERKYVRPGEAAVRRNAERDQVRVIRRWTGPLDKQQRLLVTHWALQRPYVSPAWLEYRRGWVAQFGKVLASRSEPGFCERFAPLVQDPGEQMPAALRELSDRNRQTWVQLLIDLSRTLSDKQRRHVKNKILEFAQDFEDLSAQPCRVSPRARAGTLGPRRVCKAKRFR